ncbi:MAG: enolase C-terminal domain-like protein [Bryobacterales bacterium]
MVPWQHMDIMKEITDAVDIPILTGEDIFLKEEFKRLIDGHAVDIVHPDLASSGGLLETKKIGDYAQEAGVGMAMHFAGTPISFMANVHRAAATENFIALENHLPMPWWSSMVKTTGKAGLPLFKDGYAPVQDGPGLGVELVDEVVKEHLYEPGYFEPTPDWDKARRTIGCGAQQAHDGSLTRPSIKRARAPGANRGFCCVCRSRHCCRGSVVGRAESALTCYHPPHALPRLDPARDLHDRLRHRHRFGDDDGFGRGELRHVAHMDARAGVPVHPHHGRRAQPPDHPHRRDHRCTAFARLRVAGHGLHHLPLAATQIASIIGVTAIMTDVFREWTAIFGGSGVLTVISGACFIGLLLALFWVGRHQFFLRVLAALVALMGVAFVFTAAMVAPDVDSMIEGFQPYPTATWRC